MPIYNIKCTNCSFSEEYLAVNFDSLLVYLRMKKCPRCESRLERAPSLANFTIEGGTERFYKNE